MNASRRFSALRRSVGADGAERQKGDPAYGSVLEAHVERDVLAGFNTSDSSHNADDYCLPFAAAAALIRAVEVLPAAERHCPAAKSRWSR